MKRIACLMAVCVAAVSFMQIGCVPDGPPATPPAPAPDTLPPEPDPVGTFKLFSAQKEKELRAYLAEAKSEIKFFRIDVLKTNSVLAPYSGVIRVRYVQVTKFDNGKEEQTNETVSANYRLRDGKWGYEEDALDWQYVGEAIRPDGAGKPIGKRVDGKKVEAILYK